MTKREEFFKKGEKMGYINLREYFKEQGERERADKKKKLAALLDKYGESKEAVVQNSDVRDSFEYMLSEGDRLIDEVIEDRRKAREKSSFPQTPYPLAARENPNYVTQRNIADGGEEKIDYSKYGIGFTKEYIDKMLGDTRFAKAMLRTRVNEGGYVNHPSDRGGETNYGISSRAYPDEDIKNMSRERANAIYYRDYWISPKINQLPDDFAEVVFDNGVVQGQKTAIMNLQKALGVHADGIIGSDTLNAAKITDYKSIRTKFIKNVHMVEDAYQQKNPSQRVFERGHRKRYNNY